VCETGNESAELAMMCDARDLDVIKRLAPKLRLDVKTGMLSLRFKNSPMMVFYLQSRHAEKRNGLLVDL